MQRTGILCFLKKDSQVLLAKFDYGNGRIVWNGLSGFVEEGEKLEDAVVREVKEETALDIDSSSLEYKGNHKVSDVLNLEVFIATRWEGVPASKEASLLEIKWFNLEDMPYDQMFEGNKDWLPDLIN